MNFQVNVPTKINFGMNEILRLGEICSPFGKKALVITMHDLVELGVLDSALKSLDKCNIDYYLCDKIKPEPLVEDLDALRPEIELANADFIIGVGGGSVMDACKAMAIMAKNPGSIWEYVDLRGRGARDLSADPLPVIAVPTTSGTGAEMTMNSVITNRASAQKATIKFKSIYPREAIIDPGLTLSLPASVTGMTAFDAFAHALESFINKANRSPFSDMVAAESMKLIYKYLPIVMSNLEDIEARENCAWASVLAGISIANAGTTVAHAIAQPATARMGLAHGLAVAVFTIPVLQHTFFRDEKRFAKLATILDTNTTKGLSVSAQAKLAVELIERLQVCAGVNNKLSDFGANNTIIDELTEDTVGYMGRGLPQHPVLFDRNEIREIISESY